MIYAGGFDEIGYTNDQNLLSDIETISTGTFTADYDGYIFARGVRSSGWGPAVTLTVKDSNNNSIVIYGEADGGRAQSLVCPVKKGDEYKVAYASGNAWARWFKVRDYSNR